MSALRPLFAAAGLLLLIALVFLAVRSGDDTAVPTAGETVSPGETAPDDVAVGEPTDESTSLTSGDTACGIACGDEADGTTGSGTDDTTGTDGDQPSAETACGIACGDDTGTTGSGTDDTTGTDGDQPSDETACGVACGDDTGATGDTTGTDTGTTGTDTGDTTGTDTGTTEGTGTTTTGTDILAIDDMPDTGGGIASVLGGLVALGASAGFARRR